MMILLIALIPALAVFVTAIATDSKTKTTIAALTAAALGVFTGNPAFAAIDLVFVGVAYWVAMTVIKVDSSAVHQTDANQKRTEDLDLTSRNAGYFKCGFVERAAQDAAIAAETIDACKAQAALARQRFELIKEKRVANSAASIVTCESAPLEISKPVPDKGTMS